MPDDLLVEVLLDSWDRNNTITTNLLRAVPDGGMDVRPAADSPSIAELFSHMHYVRVVFVAEDAPDEVLERRAHVSDVNALVHEKPFGLMKHR